MSVLHAPRAGASVEHIPRMNLPTPASASFQSTCSHYAARLLALVLAVSLASAIGFAANEATKPNILLIQADDAGWGDYSFNGNTTIRTPHIDSIAQNGVALDRFYVCPVCSPTRAELLTGRYHLRCGVTGVSLGQERLNLDEKTVANHFKAAGYSTGAFGKWHNGSQWPYHPMARGFDTYVGHTSGHWGEYFDPPLEHEGRMQREKGYIADICTNHALGFIEKNRDKPFLCYVPFTTPHSPWAAPGENWGHFKDKKLEQQATDPAQEDPSQTRCALAMVENQDTNVGRLLAKLRELKLTDNTIVVYISDNGPNSARWNGGMKGRKSSTDEGGVRSPCFIQWPARIKPGRTVPVISGAIDLLPTLTGLADVKVQGGNALDGRDLSNLLVGHFVEPSDRIIFSSWGGRISARTQRHRLDSEGHLFDMQTDPGQTTPIESAFPEVQSRLQQAVQAWKTELPPTAFPTKEARAKKGPTVDARPFTVGYREFPITMLPARDGEPLGNVKRSSQAPNCSYFVNWKSTEDRIEWNVEVATTGVYRASVDYTCAAGDENSEVELGFKSSSVRALVNPAWDPPLYTNQDTIPRGHGESQMKEFRTLDLGDIRLEKGAGPIVLRAVKIPGKSVMDLRRLTLTLKASD